MESDYSVFVGIDLAMTASHQAFAWGGDLGCLGERRFEHSAKEIHAFVEWVLGLATSPERVVVGLESPHGPVVEELLGRGISVFHLNPKQLDRFRDRESVAGAKDDRRDARCLARSLATDLHCFRRVEPQEPVYVRLREASRERERLVSDLGGQANRLRDELHRLSPALLALCPGANERWLWDVLALYPTPADASNFRRGKVREILRVRRIRRFDLEKLKAALRSPPVRVAPGVLEAARGRVLRLIKALRVIEENVREVESEIRSALTEARFSSEDTSGKVEQRDAAIVLSMPGVGTIVGATLLGEATQALRDRDYALFRCLAGIAPVTKASGKRSRKRAKVTMRRACSARLRNAMHHMAQVASQRTPRRRRTTRPVANEDIHTAARFVA
ncbi:MAG: transposase [Planctomycetes bacterium]|nr:transposase [Planctomycetota bacterium]